MPKVEKAVHLDAYKLYMEMGGRTPAFMSAFVQKFKRNDRTARRWENDFSWKERAKKPIDEAIEELEESQKLDAEELIGGLLDLCRNRMDGLATQASYLEAIFGTAFKRIPSAKIPEPENPIEVTSISDLNELVLAKSRLIKDEQAYMRLLLTMVGSPEQILEERMIVQFRGLEEGLFDDDSSDADI